MTGLLVFSDDLTKYDFGSDHPMAPGRVTNTISLARQLGVLDRLQIVPPPEIDLALLQTVHTPDYIAAVQAYNTELRTIPAGLYSFQVGDVLLWGQLMAAALIAMPGAIATPVSASNFEQNDSESPVWSETSAYT